MLLLFNVAAAWAILAAPSRTHAFVVPTKKHHGSFALVEHEAPHVSSSLSSSTSCLYASNPRKQQQYQPKKKKVLTLGDLRREIRNNPDKFIEKPKKRPRTRKRVENPQQSYVYASQRGKRVGGIDASNQQDSMKEGNDSVPRVQVQQQETAAVIEARQLGLTIHSSSCEPIVGAEDPTIVGSIRLEEGSGSGAFAYVVNKPQGWSVLGSSGGSGSGSKNQKDDNHSRQPTAPVGSPSANKQNKKKGKRERIRLPTEDGSKEEVITIHEDDILALLSPEERREYLAEGGGVGDDYNMNADDMSAGVFDDDDLNDFDEAELLAVMSPEEIAEYKREQQQEEKENRKPVDPLQTYQDIPREELSASVQDNLRRIENRQLQNKKNTDASFETYARPSLVSWLKETKAAEGIPIRGGTFWKAITGATEVDDSGLVVLCPKSGVNDIFVDACEYVSVIGNGGKLALKGKASIKDLATENVDMSLISKVRKGREGDNCEAILTTVTGQKSVCANMVPLLQAQFGEGVRGDPAGDPFDRRAPRRLIHCNSVSLSSLSFDEDIQVETEVLPDDIAILSDRLNRHEYEEGSFLGRASLSQNPETNAYREINGNADGFPGWTVDRYSDWLFVQHDEKQYRGPLPSIHDGKTAGVYYLSALPDRGSMGTGDSKTRPQLLEGKPAPDIIPVKENGIVYHVSLDKDLSTGMFLDQRNQRAWLTRHCNQDTHVLNCFAHCGAFSVAAATAGASTVSLDLNKKWLDRVEPQLLANGVSFDERHDCIYGDCFQWLEKLGKRGEKYDIVILDPPSSSIGKKKKRWSVKNDMDELVALAAPLVKKGGLLWTTTNSAGVSPMRFAKMCKKGLDHVGLEGAKLERIQPMPVDFPSIGPQTVKNLAWRIPSE